LIRDFYTRVVNCPLTSVECPYALKNFSTGDIPRGFSSKGRIHPDILVVRKNPGHADKAEKKYYQGKSGRKLFDALLQYGTDHRSGKIIWSKGTGRFRRNELRYLLFILGYHRKLRPFKGFELDDTERKHIHRHVFFTNLFKCSTRDEQAKIPDSAFSVCYEKYFVEELNLIRPRLILATGREVYRFLRCKEKSGEIAMHVIYVKHPSYFYSRDNEQRELSGIKHSVQQIIDED
jgi:uracil-DNA glycosylase